MHSSTAHPKSALGPNSSGSRKPLTVGNPRTSALEGHHGSTYVPADNRWRVSRSTRQRVKREIMLFTDATVERLLFEDFRGRCVFCRGEAMFSHYRA